MCFQLNSCDALSPWFAASMALCHFSEEKGRDDDDDHDDEAVERRRRSAFLRSTFHLFTQQLAKSSGSVAVTLVQNLSDCSRHFLQYFIPCTLFSVFSPSWVLADSYILILLTQTYSSSQLLS